MKTVKDYLDLGLVFVDGDKLLSATNNKDSKEVCMSGLCIAHQRYCDGFRGGNAIFFYPSEWAPSSFAWRNNEGVKPEYKGLIEVGCESGDILEGISSDFMYWWDDGTIIKWRPVVLQSNDAKKEVQEKFLSALYSDSQASKNVWNAIREQFCLPVGIDSQELMEAFKSLKDYLENKLPNSEVKLIVSSSLKAEVMRVGSEINVTISQKEETPKTTMTVNIEGHGYLLVSHTPTVSPKEDKPMKPVYTAEMHAKGVLPPVGSECILIVNNEPRPAKVTYIGKDIVCCSNVDGDAEYACLLGTVSFELMPKNHQG